jgi:pimeloyl-ACP methyl ester carboxylesterase
MNTIDPFRPAVSEPAIAELAARLDHVRWPDEAPPSWPYYARLHGRWPIEGRVEVPTGYAAFAREILRPPRQAAKRQFAIRRWTEMPHGGHFAACKQPELLAGEIRAFFRDLL